MPGTYTYEPSQITVYGKDRMRFELGDVMVDGKDRTCALCDEEYHLLTEGVKTVRAWKKAKLKCLESIFRRFSYEPDTKVGPASFSLNERAKLWQEEYEKLKKELAASSATPGAILKNSGDAGKQPPPYFYNGMMSTEESEGRDI